MAGLFILLGLCVVMAVASFLAGAVPLSMTLSQSQLRLLSSVGVGVLVGTSMVVIIPEGIEAATTPAESSHAHRTRSLVKRVPWMHAGTARDIVASIPTAKVSRLEIARGEADVAAALRQIADDTLTVSETVRQRDEATSEKPEDHEHEHGEDEQGQEEEHHHAVQVPTFEIGFSMILGFILMFLIDRLPRHATEVLQSAPQPHSFSLDTLGGGGVSSPADDESEGFLGSLTPTPRRARSLATTVGLVIHAAADGIAMGASATAGDMSLGLIIFFAIMIHKAPAAFGLTSVLLKQGLSKRAARGHLVVFSLAAPVGALATYLLILLVGGDHAEGSSWWTGMLLLFSGGTFLYVAMHAMQEDAGSHGSDHGPAMNGDAESGAAQQRKVKGPQMRDTLATMAGMLLPLLTQIGGHHHH